MVTSCFNIPNPPHALVRVYGKKTVNGGLSLYLNYTLKKKRHQHCLRLYVEPDTDKRGKVDKQTRLQNLNVINRAMERRMEVERHLLEKISESDKGLPQVCLMSYLCDFIEESALYRKGNSYAFALRHVAYHLRKFLGNRADSVTLDDVTPEFCRKFICYLKTAKKSNNKKLSPTSTSFYLSFFRSTMANAVKDELIDCNPFDKLKKYELITRMPVPRDFLTERELKRLKANGDPKSVVEKAFFFSCYTGLRISDICQLSWENLRFSEEGVEMNIVMQKTDKPLRMKLCKKALLYLPRETKEEGLIFDMPSKTTMMKHIKSWSKRAGISKCVVFHTARHTFGTLLAEKGVAIEVIQKLMGHESINTTTTYIEVSDKAKDLAVDRL